MILLRDSRESWGCLLFAGCQIIAGPCENLAGRALLGTDPPNRLGQLPGLQFRGTAPGPLLLHLHCVSDGLHMVGFVE